MGFKVSLDNLEQAIENFKVDIVNRDFLSDIIDAIGRDGKLVRVNTTEDVYFIGDLHGDYESLKRIISLSHERSGIYVFLGDYVDRGPSQLETFLGVLIFKLFNKDRTIVLRGNHEDPFMNEYYGFIYHLMSRLKGEWRIFYQNFIIPLYVSLPVSAVIKLGEGLRIFAVHGGIPIEAPSLDELEKIPEQETITDSTLLQLLWNDPREGLEEYEPSFRGPGIYYFGRRILEEFLSKNDLSLVIRAHEPVEDGYEALFNGKLYTVFTCRFYGIKPAILRITKEGIIEPIFI